MLKTGSIHMLYGQIPHIEKNISGMIQGTIPLTTDHPNYSINLLDTAFAAGCNTFDTASVYHSGKSEKMLGRWIERNHNRKDVVIIGKGAHEQLNKTTLVRDLQHSLDNLQMDYLDLYHGISILNHA